MVPANREDMRSGAAFEYAWIQDSAWMPKLHSLDEIETHYTTTVFNNRTCFAAKDADNLLGVTAIEPQSHFIDLLYVRSDSRNMGVGAALLRKAQTTLSPLAQLWTFQSNVNSHRFYQRHGFVERRRTQGEGNDEKLPDILMEWRAA